MWPASAEAVLGETSLSETALQAALSAIDEPAFIVSPLGHVLYSNSKGRALLATRGEVSMYRQLVSAIHSEGSSTKDPSVQQGELVLVPFEVEGMTDHYLVRARTDASEMVDVLAARAAELWGLTRRQSDVLACIAKGASNKDIASALGISVRTVEIHVTTILARAGVETRSALASAMWEL